MIGFSSLSCDCKNVTFQQESNRSDIIFKGSVTGKIDSTFSNYYTFKVLQVWKGISVPTITLKTNANPAACGAVFEVGKEYIVYAVKGQTSLCSRNELFSISSDLPQLNYKYFQSENEVFGKDQSPVLNDYEADYFNSVFFDRRFQRTGKKEQFDFKNKQLVFLNSGAFISKPQFFNFNKLHEPQLRFFQFTETQRRKANGYHGIVYIDGVPKLSKRETINLIKQRFKLHSALMGAFEILIFHPDEVAQDVTKIAL